MLNECDIILSKYVTRYEESVWSWVIRNISDLKISAGFYLPHSNTSIVFYVYTCVSTFYADDRQMHVVTFLLGIL